MGIPLGPADFTRGAAKPLDDQFVKADLTARDAIVSGIRYEGMMVYVVADQTMYQLQGGVTNSDWVGVGGASTSANQANLIENLGVSTTVASNQLIINIKQADGSAPSSGSGAVRVATRNSSLTNGTYNVREITAPLSLTLDFLSNLGHTNGNDHPIWVYLIDNAGALELAVSTVLFKKEIGIVSTLAEGGGFANTNYEMYSTAARTNVPFTLVGKLISNQPTAGNWTNAISKIVLCPEEEDYIEETVWTSTGSPAVNNAVTKIVFNQIDRTSHGCYNSADGNFTQPRDGDVEFGGFIHLHLPSTVAATIIANIYRNGNLYKEKYLTTYVANNYPAEVYVKCKGSKGDIWDFRVYQNTGADRNLFATSSYSHVAFRMK